MRPLSVIAIAVTGVFLCASTSSIRNNDTQATYAFQDSVLPFPAFTGIEDAQIAGGTQQKARNFGIALTLRTGFSAAAGGPHRSLLRLDPFPYMDSLNVAAIDSCIAQFTNDTTPVNSPLVDTLCFFAEAEGRWVEGTGAGGAGDTINGCSGSNWSNSAAGQTDSTWGAFRSGKADSTKQAGLAGSRLDSLIVYDPKASDAWGRMTQTAVDRAPYPSAIKLTNNLLTPSGSAFTVNITTIARYFWDRRLPLNIYMSLKADTTGQGGGAGVTPDSCCPPGSANKLDLRSSEYGIGGIGTGTLAGKITQPKITYYVRLKRVPQMIGDRPGVR